MRPFDEALLVLGRVVLGVLGQVALRARLGDGLDHGVALDRLQPVQLFLELLGAARVRGMVAMVCPSLVQK
jgi:hypothetical protein